MLEFKVGDRVKWFGSCGKGANKHFSMVPNFGIIKRLTPKFAEVIENGEYTHMIPKSELNWH